MKIHQREKLCRIFFYRQNVDLTVKELLYAENIFGNAVEKSPHPFFLSYSLDVFFLF